MAFVSGWRDRFAWLTLWISFVSDFEFKGDNIPKQIPSDIYLIAEQKHHGQFIRRGSDLIMLLEVSLLEHLTGTTKFIRHLEEHGPGSKAPGYKMLKVKIPPLKMKLVVRNKGMPKTSIVNGKGLIIKLLYF